ncbi:phenylacetate-CoA ligase [Tistlia consotensis]|uniref:Phenylacetate-CoA ligase n=1 Tax=Tistlia consotensis USBA 355 TaxID=560819 RepID=A0A1Y6BMJ8_9PROT|nr:AMP-binding protein [Tistlia consotensis]SMF11490.1 phenylacetate-CoA ligase [Tistlia consotensis USBA 355]SNR51909.1 phenylacetate-CoA ligase [Tistlia consotensis]
MSRHYDELETRSGEAREADLFERLRGQIARAKATEGYRARLAELDPASVRGWADLGRLPVTRKADLIRLQKQQPPFGGFNALAPGEAGRIFVSPGPIFELQGRDSDYRRMARGLFAAGFRPGELVHNCFAYHLTPGGWIMDAGAQALGCAVIAAGVGNSEQQAEAIAHLRPQGYAGTPDFLKVLLDKAAELGLDCGSITKALVSGGALFPSLRAEYAERGVAVKQCYATAELGLVAYEAEAPDGSIEGLIVDEGCLLEIVRPGTGDPVADGEVGEVVVTTFNPAYPLLRLATGDLSAILPGTSPCGRTNRRIKGWMGRADQTTKVKGMFVHPEQVAEAVKRFPAVVKARLVVEREGERDRMVLKVETSGAEDSLGAALAEALQAATKLRGDVELLAPGSLPNDGKVIDDQRKYD